MTGGILGNMGKQDVEGYERRAVWGRAQIPRIWEVLQQAIWDRQVFARIWKDCTGFVREGLVRNEAGANMGRVRVRWYGSDARITLLAESLWPLYYPKERRRRKRKKKQSGRLGKRVFFHFLCRRHHPFNKRQQQKVP